MSATAVAPGAVLLRRFAAARDSELAVAIDGVVSRAPFRQMITPGGRRMSVAMTNCGTCGWVSDRCGYRYTSEDPESGEAWPEMPVALRRLAQDAADAASFAGFDPDCCLINRYAPRTGLSLHQDKDERDFSAPIVSVSLGVPATFLFGGLRRKDSPQRIVLAHGDVIVWGGPARLRYHGIARLAVDRHPFAGASRLNLTFRRAR